MHHGCNTVFWTRITCEFNSSVWAAPHTYVFDDLVAGGQPVTSSPEAHNTTLTWNASSRFWACF